MIEVKGLVKRFGDNLVLDHITESIHKGRKKWVIVGPSGSGKSTFLRRLNRLEEASEGKSGLKTTWLQIKM